MAKISAYPSAGALTAGTELVLVVQGGVDKKATVQQFLDQALSQVRAGVAAGYDTLLEEHAFSAAIGSSLTAHLAETDPIVHEADKIGYSGTVVAATVAAALDVLNADKVSASAIPELTRMITSSGATVNKNTTAAEETLITVNLAPNAMDANGDLLVIEAAGDVLANSGAPTFTWKLKNGTVLVDTPADALTVSANLRRWKLRATIRRLTAVSQSMAFTLEIGQPGTTGAMVVDKSYVGNITDFTATDFSAAMTVLFTVQMSVSNANDRVRMYGFDAYKVAA